MISRVFYGPTDRMWQPTGRGNRPCAWRRRGVVACAVRVVRVVRVVITTSAPPVATGRGD